MQQVTSQSCSCTSCFYRSDSERPSLRRVIDDGSKIDKLYFGKYIPLRERKLLGKLVKTRAVYDEVRDKLLSGSNVSVAGKAKLKPKAKIHDETSRAVVELVDVIDRGAARKLSNCCSCCSCSSEYQLTSKVHKHRRHTRGSARSRRGGAQSYKRRAHTHYADSEASTVSGLSVHTRIRKPVPFKARNIRSAPCNCTFTEMMDCYTKAIKSSISNISQRKSLPSIKFTYGTYEKNNKVQKGRQLAKKSLNNIRRSRKSVEETFRRSMKKLRESKTKMKRNLQTGAGKSMERIRQTNTKIKGRMSTVRRSMQVQCLCKSSENNVQNTFAIRKDSIIKYREYLQKKKKLAEWECEQPCDSDVCDPNKCLDKIEQRRTLTWKHKDIGQKATKFAKHDKNIGESSTTSTIGIQAQETGTTVKVATTKKLSKHQNLSSRPQLTANVGTKKNEARKKYATQNTKKPKEKYTPQTTVSASSVQQRQAVRIGSSFSFDIEFYKNKSSPQSQPIVEPIVRGAKEKQNHTKKRNEGSQSKKLAHRHRMLELKLKQLKKDTQSGGHTLKRCFCTLKLKQKKHKLEVNKSDSKGTKTPKKIKGIPKSSTESIQTQKALRPCECECVKYHSARSNTDSQSRSTSSLTKSTSSASKRIQAHSLTKTRGIKQPPHMVAVKSLNEDLGPQKQAVRIGSSFTFSIEFYKQNRTGTYSIVENPDYKHEEKGKITEDLKRKPDVLKRKRDRSVDKKRRHLRHRHSQRRISTGKSKYTLTKNSLRKCFCTLKLGKPGKGKVTSRQISSVSQTQEMGQKYIITSKSTSTQNKIQNNKLLAYECEPGICVPNECNPYECLKIIKKRQGTHPQYHAKHSITENRRTRSTSSVTSWSATPSKAKRVQSTVVTYKTEVPARKYKETITLRKGPKQIRASPNNTKQQAVRIGSSFSFDIEFFKDKKTPVNNNVKYVSSRMPHTPKNLNRNKKQKRGRGSQGDVKPKRKSVHMQVENRQRNVFVGSALKRCFCTLKLHKVGEENAKHMPMISTGTDTPILKDKGYKVVATKGTKTKQEKYKLKPYECEPGICVPGECDPYQCLEFIRKRVFSKEFGTSTHRSKMRSSSSGSISSGVSSGTGTDRSKAKKQNTSTKPYKPRTVPATYLKKPVESSRPFKQAVKIGSQFSFDVEFYKNRTPPVQKKLVVKPLKQKPDLNKTNIIKNTGAEEIFIYKSDQESQVEGEKKKQKGTGIKPMLKRCFCTLQLRDKDKKKSYIANKNETRPAQVLTVSRVTVPETKITTKLTNKLYESMSRISHKFSLDEDKKLKEKNIRYDMGVNENYSLENSQSSMSNTTLKARQLMPYNIERIYVQRSSLRIRAINKSVFSQSSSNQTSRNNSNISFDLNFFKESMNNIISKYKIIKTEKPIKIDNNTDNDNNFLSQFLTKNNKEELSFDNKLAKIREHVTNVYINRSQVSGENQFLRRCFCTMNMQVPQSKHRKLKPYECEPGVCVPYECDPNECLKLIKKRTQAFKLAGTDHTTRSSSSSSRGPVSKSRKLQANSKQYRSAEKGTNREQRGIQYKTKPSIPHRQAVRVGSSFSFNIEFTKDKSTPKEHHLYKSPVNHHKQAKTEPAIPVKGKVKGTGEMATGYHNRNSQSGVIMVNKSSNMHPKLKRCFCTLKFQKKGRPEVKVISNINEGTMTPPNKEIEIVKTGAVNTDQNMKAIRAQKNRELDPNECEPGICVPGKCNPHECLELIKKRNRKYHTKGFGSEFVSRSTGSLTQSGRIRRGKAVQSGMRGKIPRGNAANFSDPISKVALSRRAVSPKRQAVRIGSSFSFNIEFYKDKSPQADRAQDAVSVVRLKAKTQKNKKHKTNRGSASEGVSQYSRESQSGVGTENRGSGVGPRLKRCFFTLKFQKQGKHPAIDNQVKLVTQGTKTRVITEMPTFHNKGAITHENNKWNISKLKPYECEPGVCIPGECNSHECAKLIKKRLRRDLGTSTDNRTKSEAIMSSATGNKARKVQYSGKKNKTHDQPIQSKYMIVKQRYKSDRPSREAIRIGSSFSFDIEFFKDCGGDTGKVINAPKIGYAIPSTVIKSPKIKRTTGGSQYRSSTFTTESQTKNGAQKGQTTMTGSFLKRCFCTLALKKAKTNLIAPIKMSEVGTGTDKIKNKPKIEYKTTGTKTNKYANLKPYECEPGVCVQGECNPKECLERINKRNMKEFGTITGNPQTRTTGTVGTGHTKERGGQYGDHGKNVKTTVMSKVPETSFSRPHSKSNKQALRIGSSFSFDVEFFKGGSVKETPILLQKEKIEHPKRPSSASFRHRKSQRPKNVRNMDSQVLAQRARTTMTGISPLLKRCFCTLRLQNQNNAMIKSPPTNKIASAGSNTNKVEVLLAPKTDTAANMYKLKPYECEPGYCVPGKCDPYECKKRIRATKKHSIMAGTNRERGRSISSSASGTGKAGKQTQFQSAENRDQNIKSIGKYINEKPFKTMTRSHRQALRVGSSFSFNLEFYKNTTSQLPKVCNALQAGDFQKPKIMQETVPKKTKNQSCQVICVSNCQSQVAGSKKHSTGVGSMLKRCFCTLKLQNKKHKQKHTPCSKTQTPSKVFKVETADIGTGTRKKIRGLLPYECEPNICVPGECNPFECVERIRKRQMKNSTTGTKDFPTGNASTLTSKKGQFRSRNSQFSGGKIRQIKTAPAYKPQRTNFGPRNPHISDCPTRQAVCISSSFSFDIEFFKENKTPRKVDMPRHLDYEPIPDTKTIPKLGVNRGSHRLNQPLHHQKSQMVEAMTASKGSGTSPQSRRCFCTLKLIKKPIAKDTKIVDAMNFADKPKILTQNKKKSTKKNGYPLKMLDPNECEPGVCFPGQCDPYVCLERINKRKLKSTGTGTPRLAQVHQSTTAKKCLPSCKTKKINFQSHLADNINQETNVSLRPEARIVEEPRFPLLMDRQAVKICSNFSFNIEFYKQNSPSGSGNGEYGIETQPYDNRGNGDTRNIKTTRASKNTGIASNAVKLNTCSTQAKCTKTRNTGSNVDKIFKKCFCTLKLLNTSKPPLTKKMPNNRVIEVRRVAVEEHRKIPRLYRNIDASISKINVTATKTIGRCDLLDKSKYFKLSDNSQKKIYAKPGSIQMTTIYPYIPTKFNKNFSKTILIKKCQKSKYNSHSVNSNNNKKVSRKRNVPINVKNKEKIIPNVTIKSTYHTNLLSSKQGTTLPNSSRINIKQILSRCVQFFVKNSEVKKKPISNHRQSIIDTTQNHHELRISKRKNDKRLRNTKLSKADLLKTSSDRRPNNSNIGVLVPKKSKSLKVTKVSEKEKYFKNQSKLNYPEQGMNKYTCFQSGDQGQHEIKTAMCDFGFTPSVSSKYKIHLYSYRQVKKETKINLNKQVSPFIGNKIVQFSLVSPKLNVNKKIRKSNFCDPAVCGTDVDIYCPCYGDGKSTKTQKTQHANKIKFNEVTLAENYRKNRNLSLPPTPGILKNKSYHVQIPKESEKNNEKGKDEKSKDLKGKDDKNKGENKIRKEEKIPKNNQLVTKITLPDDKLKCNLKKHCPCCGSRGAGKLGVKTKKCVPTCKTVSRVGIFSRIHLPKKKKAPEYKPMFDIKLGSQNMEIINKDEISAKIAQIEAKKRKGNIASLTPEQLAKLHGKFCKCCYCQSARTEVHKKKFSVASLFRIGPKPCICGSPVCATEVDKIREDKKKFQRLNKLKNKKCVCGAPICAKETEKIIVKRKLISQKELKAMKHRKKKLKRQKASDKQYRARQARHKKEDKMRLKQQIKDDKREEQQMKKYQDSHDLVLLAESGIDITKLGLKTAAGIVRTTAGTIMNPKRTYRFIDDSVHDPSRICPAVENAYRRSGVHATARRVKFRCLAMSIVQRFQTKMESTLVGHYLVHMFDKDPTARLRKTKQARKRERTDFECSLFMGSLRKRPWLSVYNCCPWFYPHCISIINVWRQFTDILLFLLAVAVWSPCILCMELCRAFMCCTLCTA